MMAATPLVTGAIVLAGGRSRRMGVDKTGIQIGGRSLLSLACETARSISETVVIAAAEGQVLPPDVAHQNRVDDAESGLGPLAGIMAGMKSLERLGCTIVYVLPCDHPRLLTNVYEVLHEKLDSNSEARCAAVKTQTRTFPLLSAWRITALPLLETAVRNRELRARDLLRAARAVYISDEDIRPFDPELACLVNVNEPRDLENEASRE